MYYKPLILNIFSKDWKKYNYDTGTSTTNPGVRSLTLLELFDIECHGVEKDNSSRKLRSIDEKRVITNLVSQKTDKLMFSLKTKGDALRYVSKHYDKAKSNIIFERTNSGGDISLSLLSSYSHTIHFLDSALDQDDIVVASSTGKLGRIHLYENYYVVENYNNIDSYMDIHLNPLLNDQEDPARLNKSDRDRYEEDILKLKKKLWDEQSKYLDAVEKLNQEQNKGLEYTLEELEEDLYEKIKICYNKGYLSELKDCEKFAKAILIDARLNIEAIEKNIEKTEENGFEINVDDSIDDESIFKHRLDRAYDPKHFRFSSFV